MPSRDERRAALRKRSSIQVYVTAEDKRRIEDAALARGRRSSEFLRELALAEAERFEELTKPHSEPVMQPSPRAIVSPLPEVGVDALPRRKVARQHPPLDTTHSQVENGINGQTHIQAAGASARFGRWNQMLDNKPLAVSQICWVSFCFHKDYVYHYLADSLYFSNNLLRRFDRQPVDLQPLDFPLLHQSPAETAPGRKLQELVVQPDNKPQRTGRRMGCF